MWFLHPVQLSLYRNEAWVLYLLGLPFHTAISTSISLSKWWGEERHWTSTVWHSCSMVSVTETSHRYIWYLAAYYQTLVQQLCRVNNEMCSICQCEVCFWKGVEIQCCRQAWIYWSEMDNEAVTILVDGCPFICFTPQIINQDRVLHISHIQNTVNKISSGPQANKATRATPSGTWFALGPQLC